MIGFLDKNGAPGEIRTPDRSVRSRVLYPAELRALDLVWRGGEAPRRAEHLTDVTPIGKAIPRLLLRPIVRV